MVHPLFWQILEAGSATNAQNMQHRPITYYEDCKICASVVGLVAGFIVVVMWL